jgi:chloride channel protein, CIC family
MLPGNTNNMRSALARVRDIIYHSEISRYVSHIVLSMLIGLFAGGSAILFYALLEKFRLLFEPVKESKSLLGIDNVLMLVPMAGGIIVSLMTIMMPAVAREKGITSLIKSVILDYGYIPLRQTVFHFIAPLISIGFGAPLGPEAPSAKIGSGAGSFLSQMLGLNRKEMRMYTTAGAGAAISAVFNAPIAGVFFGIEVILLNDLKNQALSALIISSVVADILSRSILGNHHVFAIPAYTIDVIREFPYYLMLSIACGALSILLIKLRKTISHFLIARLKIKNPFITLIPVSLVFGYVLLHYHHLYGVGYNTINELLNGRFHLDTIVVLLVLKLLFMALFLETGSYGGTFAPSLMLGAFLGFLSAAGINGLLKIHLDPVAFALIGMGGMLSGVNSIPLTSMLLVFEVTSDYRFILPLMLVSIISYLVVVYVNKGTVYVVELLQEGIDVSRRSEIDLLGRIKVKELMRADFLIINYQMPFSKLKDMIINSSYGDIFIVDDEQKLKGTVSLKEIRQALTSTDLVDLLIASDIAIPVPVVCEDDTVSVAMQEIEKYDMEFIPVVKNSEDKVVCGVVSHKDIILAYNRLLAAWEADQYQLRSSATDAK